MDSVNGMINMSFYQIFEILFEKSGNSKSRTFFGYNIFFYGT